MLFCPTCTLSRNSSLVSYISLETDCNADGIDKNQQLLVSVVLWTPSRLKGLQEPPSKTPPFLEVPDRSLSEVCQKFVRVRPLSETTRTGFCNFWLLASTHVRNCLNTPFSDGNFDRKFHQN